MKYILATVLLLTGFLGTTLASQGPTNTKWMLYGHGVSSCGQWTADRASAKDGHTTGNEVWVSGYITAVSMINEHPLAKTDSAAMTHWMDNYCAANPLTQIAHAAKALGQALIDAH